MQENASKSNYFFLFSFFTQGYRPRKNRKIVTQGRMYANQRARNSLADGVSIRSEQFLSGGTISDSIRRTTVATRRPSAISENNEGALCEKMSIYFADTESQISTGGATQPCWPEKKNPQAACVEGSRTIRNEEAKRIRAP